MRADPETSCELYKTLTPGFGSTRNDALRSEETVNGIDAVNTSTCTPSDAELPQGCKGMPMVPTRFPWVATKVNFHADFSEEPRWFDVADTAFGSQY